ncbi:MAG: type I restriction enzyme HsdR N-terminal domain-containing protein [Verrucomicrobia bacterium]|nr:type I restriction enzyme HsdR N-terminal domain-containing protein [Verrucomicrobiota bacterium]
MTIPGKIATRLTAGIKRFQPIVEGAKSRDINESDTVIIVTDMLEGVFGFDKYSEVTSEMMIRSTFCDLAIRLDGKVRVIIEVKAIGLELKEAHVKQAVDYAANQGIEWVVLTNGLMWQVYRVIFAQPIGQEIVADINFLALNSRLESDLELLYMLSREGFSKSLLDDYHTQRQAMSRFFLAAMMLSEPVLMVMRRELKRVSPDVKIDTADIARALTDEVLKRDVMESDKFQEAKRKICRSQNRSLRASKSGLAETAVALTEPTVCSPPASTSAGSGGSAPSTRSA